MDVSEQLNLVTINHAYLPFTRTFHRWVAHDMYNGCNEYDKPYTVTSCDTLPYSASHYSSKGIPIRIFGSGSWLDGFLLLLLPFTMTMTARSSYDPSLRLPVVTFLETIQLHITCIQE